MAIIFSKNSGLNDDFWKVEAQVLQAVMSDTDKEQNGYDDFVNKVFNVKTQEASAEAAFTSNVAPYYLAVGSQTEHYTLSMDYILASKNQQDIKDVELTAKKNSSVLNTQTFSNIPLQRNYRTNILGNLLTTTGVFTVETAPVWASPENNENK